MIKIKHILTSVALATLLASCNQEVEKDYVDYVNPYIGNISHLLVPTFPTVPAPTQETTPDATGETVEETQPIEYGYNVMDLNFPHTGVDAIDSINTYVQSLTPSKKNAYTGLFEGKNLILITAEAFTAETIDPVRTPTLYRMANEGIKFEEYDEFLW